MAAECVPEGPDLKEMGEEDVWELINDNRHRISLGVKPCMLIPYLRQARVLTEMDEDEILSCLKLNNSSMRTSHMLDLLRIQGRNGAMALLESLMIHYPTIYTQVTGRKPSTEPSGFSGLIKYSDLTEYLVKALTGMQKELKEARQEASRLGSRCTSLEAQLGQTLERQEESRRFKADHGRMRKNLAAAHHDILKLKDEKCGLYARYTAVIEERSAANIHCSDLNLQVYQLQFELRKAQTETDFERQRTLKCPAPSQTQRLQEEISTLRRQLLVAEKFTPALENILGQDLVEARDVHIELAEQLRCYREENEQLTRERQGMVEDKECLALQVQKLTLDCEMYQQKGTVIQSQLRELQAERDHVCLSRDEAQAQIARSLAEKDTLRSAHTEWKFSWESQGSSSDSLPSSPSPRPRLRRMHAICPDSDSVRGCNIKSGNITPSSVRSQNVEPPCPESLRTQEKTLWYNRDSSETAECDVLLDNDFVFIPGGNEVEQSVMSNMPSCQSNNSDGLSRASAPPFLLRSRPRAMRITGRVLTISFQGEALLSQLQVVGGNKTGVFVHQVTEGSAANTVGISSGAQILEVKYEQAQQALRMVLEDTTLEEAMWALGQVRGFCHLSLRPNQDAYEKLLLQSGEAMSGDSFYVRVNMTLPGGSQDALSVSCNDILHVTCTLPAGADRSWRASHVHPCQLLDLKTGNLPNYYRAQRLLISAIEDMSIQPMALRKARDKQKTVRIVSTGRQGRNPLWVCVEDSKDKSTGPGDGSAPRGCLTLMPYTLVTPHYPPVCRPVLLLPTILGRVLDQKLAEWQGFQLCEPELLSSSEHAARLQRSEVLEECEQGGQRCYTLQSVERVMKQGTHCVLPLGLDCVRRLHRAEIFPIIIFIAQSKSRAARKLKSKVQRQGWSEEQLLECSRSEESLLDKLPCLYRIVSPDSWDDKTTLLTTLHSIILEEQKKIVWVEPDLW
ncbi:caspase recruitment domain-containing protein 14-like isoform X1 [Oncorhynchus kisutch]|uniref:Caspase recruitment domain family member 14 n=1 Tax=Oncorhynchus kisutch TaxID=8019 RepID=A0A8C7LEN9_ONCKI|nr:caspase recruitment domain-containing protein 14-like isoform X1 [Oncorhynchus kisutch]